MEEGQSLFVVPCDEPTQEAVRGIRFDFCAGLRIKNPADGKEIRVVLSDASSGVVLFDGVVPPGQAAVSAKKYFIPFRFEIYDGETLIFEHEYDASGKTVMIQLPAGTIGDVIGWFPYVEKFQQKHGCRVVAVLDKKFIQLFEKQYPDIELITRDQVAEYQPYACYYLGLFFRGDIDNQPYDFRLSGNARNAGYILGVDPAEVPPRLDLSAPRTIQDPYVCIAVQASSQCKYWNNPVGWHEVVRFLKESGYRVLCIDRDRVYGQGLVWNHIPHGCEDFTGNHPLQERVNLLKDADFFVGLLSGLSWLAWACKIPTVMIGGITHPTHEFYTPYRVINTAVCNGCWCDTRCDFDHFDFLWCPRHKDTDRQFECTRYITGKQVIDTIKTIPAWKDRSTCHGKSPAQLEP